MSALPPFVRAACAGLTTPPGSLPARLALLVALVLLTGCQPACSPGGASVPEGFEHARLIPDSARLVLFAPRLDALLTGLDGLAGHAPDTTTLHTLRAELTDALARDPLSPESWSALGADLEAPATLFHAAGGWSVVTTLSTAPSVDTLVDGLARDRVEVTSRRDGRFRIVTLRPHDSAAELHLLHDRSALVVVTRLRPDASHSNDHQAGDPPPASTAALDAIVNLPPAHRWHATDKQHRLRESRRAATAAPADASLAFDGMLDAAPWLLELPASGHARTLLARLAHQTGPLHFTAGYAPDTRQLSLYVETHGAPGEPVAITELGRPAAELPMVGGLIKPGILGAVRISTDTRKFFELIRSTYPAEQRLALDTLLRDLDQELAIDVQQAVIDNLVGHAIVVIYGIDNRVLSADNSRLLADIFQLRATREALLLPIKDREALEGVLDAATQLSRGNLRRQPVRDTIQYAWLNDGTLEWALILNDEHLIFVDSAAAFDHALAYERSPHNLNALLASTGADRIFERIDRSGLYLDTASIASLLADVGHPDIAHWLRASRSLVLTTEHVDHVGTTEITLTLH